MLRHFQVLDADDEMVLPAWWHMGTTFESSQTLNNFGNIITLLQVVFIAAHFSPSMLENFASRQSVYLGQSSPPITCHCVNVR